MDPVTLALQIVDKSLSILKLCIEDQPPEERRKAWVQWFAFWSRIEEMTKPKP